MNLTNNIPFRILKDTSINYKGIERQYKYVNWGPIRGIILPCLFPCGGCSHDILTFVTCYISPTRIMRGLLREMMQSESNSNPVAISIFHLTAIAIHYYY